MVMDCGILFWHGNLRPANKLYFTIILLLLPVSGQFLVLFPVETQVKPVSKKKLIYIDFLLHFFLLTFQAFILHAISTELSPGRIFTNML